MGTVATFKFQNKSVARDPMRSRSVRLLSIADTQHTSQGFRERMDVPDAIRAVSAYLNVGSLQIGFDLPEAGDGDDPGSPRVAGAISKIERRDDGVWVDAHWTADGLGMIAEWHRRGFAPCLIFWFDESGARAILDASSEPSF